MQIKANSVEEYLDQLSDDRREAISKVRDVVLENLPEGYVETMQYGNDKLYRPPRYFSRNL